MTTQTTDPRIDAVAAAIRDDEDGSTGWRNTTDTHKDKLRRVATRLLEAGDSVDPVRIIVRRLKDV